MRGPTRIQASHCRSRAMPALAAVVLAALLGGCATVAPDAAGGTGFRRAADPPAREARSGEPANAVKNLAQVTAREQARALVGWHRTDAERDQARTRISQLLQQRLTAAAAVELALLNHAGLQAQLAELGITQAEVMHASRLPNPGFTYGRSSEGDKREIERGLHISLARILVLPFVREMEQRRLNQAERNSALQVMALITQVRRAQVEAVAARERSRYMADVLKAAEASAELARRMARVATSTNCSRRASKAFRPMRCKAMQGPCARRWPPESDWCVCWGCGVKT